MGEVLADNLNKNIQMVELTKDLITGKATKDCYFAFCEMIDYLFFRLMLLKLLW